MNKSVLNIMLGCVVIIVLAISGCKKDTPEPTIDELKNLTTLPELIYPTNNAVEIPTTFTFEWNASAWSDGGNHGNFTYDILYGMTNPPTTKVSLTEGITEYSIPTLRLKTTYYWKIKTLRDGIVLKESEVYSFTTEKGLPPTSPSLTFPANSATECSIKPRLKWNLSTDPEGKTITYNVYLDNSSNPQTKILENQTSTSIIIPIFLEGETQYFWKVVAKDPEGNENTSEISSFTTAAKYWIPDANFRTYLKTKLPSAFQGDSLLYKHNDVTSFEGKFDVSFMNISTLKGIEYFGNIKKIICRGNELRTLDISWNSNLTVLNCGFNPLTSIDLRSNVMLQSFGCQVSGIKNLDLSNNLALTKLYVDRCDLTSLDLSKNTLLDTLQCSDNQLTMLNISSQTEWNYLFISAGYAVESNPNYCNPLTSLKVNDAVKNHQQFKNGKVNLPNMTIEVYSGGVKTCSNYDPNANGGTGLCITP